MSCSTDYSALLDIFIRLVQSQAGKKIELGEEWLNDAQTLSVKLFRHLVSMQTIAAGATVEQNKLPTIFFVDHASVKVVARAALETYLVFFYLYGSADRAASEFRHKTWRLGGLVDRQLFHASTDEHREVLANERQQIDALKAEIEKAPQFQAYTLKRRAKLLEGDWRVGNGWSGLSQQAGFHEKYFKNIYGYLCGYSHSSYLSALQVGQAQTIEDQQMLTQAILSIGVFIMAHFAFSYSSAFVSASTVLAANSEAKRVAEKWRFVMKATPSQTPMLRLAQQYTQASFASIFEIVEKEFLNHSDCHEGFVFVADPELARRYHHLIDFLFCELFGSDWPARCQQYYDDNGPSLQSYLTPQQIQQYESILLVALRHVVVCRFLLRHITWNEFRTVVLKNVKKNGLFPPTVEVKRMQTFRRDRSK